MEGFKRGRIILVKIEYLLHPSIVAASSSSLGILAINCIIWYIKNACPKKWGSTNGTKEGTSPSLL